MKTQEQLKNLQAKLEKISLETQCKLDEIQAELDDLNKPEPQKEWVDELEDGEFIIILTQNDNGFAIFPKTLNSSVYKQFTFKTEQQADLLARKCSLMVEMHKFAELRNQGWVADWIDIDQKKYGIEMYNKCTTVEINWQRNIYVFGIAVKSEAIVEEMISIFGNRIKEIYNKQYDSR